MKWSILVIEDDELLREVYATKLELEGFNVDTAPDGQAGLEKALAKEPDMILLDMIMPRMTGLEFLEAYNLPSRTPRVKAVVMSNQSSPTDITRAKALGVLDYLIKSQHTPQDIVSRIRSFLNQ